MNRALSTTAGALEIAGSLCGVPYVGTAAILLRDVVDCCNQVAVQKRKSAQLANKCAQLLLTLSEQASRLEGTELIQAVDEVTAVLDKVHGRVKRFSQLGLVRSFIKNAEIEDGLALCESELDTAMNSFHMNAQITLHQSQRDSMQLMYSNHAEMRDLLFRILTSHQEIGTIQEMQLAGENVAQPIMLAAQNELRLLRQHSNDENYLTSTRTTSPVEVTPPQRTTTPTSYLFRQSSNGEACMTPTRTMSPMEIMPPTKTIVPERSITPTRSTLPTRPITPTRAVMPGRATEPQPRDGDRYYRQYQRGLMNLHKITGILPAVKILDGEVTKEGEMAVAGGTYSDIWSGKWMGEQKVALKALRNVKASDKRIRNRFEREINVWSDLHHDHILPFYGIVTDLGQHIHMVSQWQENGNVLDFVRNFPNVDRIHLLTGAASGVEYLHSRGVIHGDLKCANILVSADGEACICDFGMSKIVEEVTERSASATLTSQGSARWLAPELIEGVAASPTFQADTYSYAMSVLELVTLKHPYAHKKRDASVIHEVVVLKRKPPRPSSIWLREDLWRLMEDCWRSEASQRPPMSQVASRMMGIETRNVGPQALDAMDT